MTKEVRPNDWQRLCTAVETVARGSQVRIESITNEGTTHTTDARPLRSCKWDGLSDPCNNRMVIETGNADERGERHEIIEPIRVKFRDGMAPGTFRYMEVAAESGGVVVEFRPPLPVAALQEVQFFSE